jgi:hypothetical protein
LENIWIGNSGSSCYFYNNNLGFVDVKGIYERIMVGNGTTMEVTKIGSQKCNIEQVYENTFQFLLQEVNFVPELWMNLLRVKKSLKNGFEIGNE